MNGVYYHKSGEGVPALLKLSSPAIIIWFKNKIGKLKSHKGVNGRIKGREKRIMTVPKRG